MNMRKVLFVAGIFVAGVVGGLGVAAMRIGDRMEYAGTGSLVFFCCLAALGLLTMLAMVCNSNTWLLFGATLAVMSVGATCDVGRCTRTSGC